MSGPTREQMGYVSRWVALEKATGLIVLPCTDSVTLTVGRLETRERRIHGGARPETSAVVRLNTAADVNALIEELATERDRVWKP